jgi:hypothetical protein
MIGRKGSLPTVVMAELQESRFFTMGAILFRKQAVQQVLVTLSHLRCLYMSCNKVWVVNAVARDKKPMNLSLLR